MVTRKRLRAVLNTLVLPCLQPRDTFHPIGAAPTCDHHLLTGPFVVDDHDLLDSGELDRLHAEHRQWERRIALLKSADVDPDMLDERARALLNYVDPHDLTLMLKRDPLPRATPKP